MSDHLERQIEEIVDTGSGSTREVIIRMGDLDPEIKALLPAASQAIRRRILSQSARELLPVPSDALQRSRGAKVTPAVRRELRGAESSFTAQVARRVVPVVAETALRAMGLGALAPLIDSDVIGKTVASALESKRKDREPPMSRFWASQSMAISLKKDDLRKLPAEVTGIRDIYPNRRLALPTYVRSQRLPQNVQDNKASSWGIAAIGALATWGAYGARGAGTKVAVLDTGIDAEHPDLAGKLDGWVEFDHLGRPVSGSTPHDSDEHGTHVSGSIVGGRASGQWIGVAPEAKVAAAMVLNGEAGGTDAQVLAGIDWAIEQDVDAINMSLGGLTLTPDIPNTYTEAIIKALRLGIPVVAAIGNEGGQTTGAPGNDLFAFAIGATDHNDTVAGFSGGRTQIIRESNFLPPDILPLPYQKPELCAPGVAVVSSIPGGEWAAFNGTSMATPHVAGAIALLLSATSIRDQVDGPDRAFLVQDLLTGSVEELGEA
jgi:subtilisin family serine protease